MSVVAIPAQDTIANTYEKVKPLLRGLANRFRQSGEDFNDSLGELHCEFMRVYEEYDPDIGTFEDAMYFYGYKRLKEIVRLKARRNKKLPRAPLNESQVFASTTSDFDMSDFILILSEDAKRVIRLVFQTPRHLQDVIDSKGGTTANVRATIKSYLQDVGWTKARAIQAFAEVTKALETYGMK